MKHRARGARDSANAAIHWWWIGCRPLRGLCLDMPTILGFRSAPPQALRYRHAPRAKYKNHFGLDL